MSRNDMLAALSILMIATARSYLMLGICAAVFIYCYWKAKP